MTAILRYPGLRITALILLSFIPAQAQTNGKTFTPEQADAYYQRKDWQNAEKAYLALTGADPKNARAWYRLGISVHSMGRFDEAIAAFQHALSSGNSPFIMYGLACSYARKNDRDAAFDWLTKALNAGFRAPGQIQQDHDLDNIRGDKRFEAIVALEDRLAKPCKYSAESRQFDFWIGEWDVQDQAGHPVGSSSIQLILGDCVIFENWKGLQGGSGKSFNAYNRETRTWQQNWMDDSGSVSNFVDGEFKDNYLRFFLYKTNPDGTKSTGRLTFYNLGPDRVRQFSELSADGGKTWTVQYDFIYLRKHAGS